MNDLKWHHIQMYMDIAKRVALESKATRMKAGIVLVRHDDINSDIVSFSYNGTAPNTNNSCESEDNITLPEVYHAEAMVVSKSSRQGKSTNGCIAFITHMPCLFCAKLLYASGIREVYFADSYRSEDGIRFLKEVGVNIHDLRTSPPQTDILLQESK